MAAEQKKVIILNGHGEKLVGILHETGSKELAILCHGFQSSKERIPMVYLAAALEKEGTSAFRFDFAGNGLHIDRLLGSPNIDSSGISWQMCGLDIDLLSIMTILPSGESEGSFQYGNYRREADDLRAVVQHFHGEKRLITAIVGHSKGGNVVLLYASKYNDVHQVVNLSGRFNLEKGMEGRLGKDFLQRIKQNGYIDVKNKRGKIEYRVTEESLVDRLTTDTRAACLSIHQDCRVLTVHGSMDKIVPAKDALEFAKHIRNHKLRIIEGADHEYTLHQEELASVVLDFIRAGSCQSEDISKQSQSCKRDVNSLRSRM